MSPERVKAMRENFVGKRIRLVYTSDPYTDLKSGDEGVIDFIDDTGTVFANWDKGSGLGLVHGEDSWELV
jgi:hypothetical protein